MMNPVLPAPVRATWRSCSTAVVPQNLLRLDEFGLSDLAACETKPQDL